MKKQIKAHEERNVKGSGPSEPASTAMPQYLLERSEATNAKALSTQIKNKRKEKAAKFSVPLPKVRGTKSLVYRCAQYANVFEGIAEQEMVPKSFHLEFLRGTRHR